MVISWNSLDELCILVQERDGNGLQKATFLCWPEVVAFSWIYWYLVDAFTKIEGNDLAYIRSHQKELRAESYKGLMDHLYRRAEHQNLLAQGHNPGTAQHIDVGRVVILPSTFTGSQRSMQQNYQDAMTIVRKHGKPDIFLTFTANPNWQDVLDNLLPNQKPQDRPDIVTRVFHLKFKELLCDILDLNFFGKVVAYVYTVEFQKRGLPHTHMIISLANEDKPRTPEDVDRIISAEIPDENTHVHEHRMVKKHMMHGPCGVLNPSCVCMQGWKCKKKFPKDLAQQTEFNVNGYPLYRRRGQTTAQLRQHRLNDSWVVPHNIKLLLKFDCHMNVEVCTTVKSVKYIFKYIHKGNDMAHVEIREGREEANARQDIVHDEIRQYLNSRYVGPHQAVYKLMQYEMHDKSHTIIRLAIHLPDQQPVCFTDPEQAAQRNNDSMLMAYFSLNQREQNSHQYLYQDIPEHYTFNKSTKQWQQRKRRAAKCVIGRIYNVLPSDAERFALRLILLHRKGATSFEDIRTVDGVTHNTFKNAARAMALLEDDAEHRRCLRDAVVLHMPAQMRQLFATLILFQTPSDIDALFTEFQEDMAEDYVRHDQLQDPNATFQQQHIHMCLADIQRNLQIHGNSLKDFPEMPQLPADYAQPRQAADEINIEQEREQGQRMFEQLNPEQLQVHNTIVQAIETQSQDNCFFLDGPAGTGKTFLYNTLVHNLQASGHKVKCVAYSGIAATLLIHGRTAHSTFQIPIPLLDDSTCNIKAQSLRAQQLRDTMLFIWDEASMIPATALKAVDRLLRDITKVDRPFGGKYFMLGGDFRQVLPVVKKAGRERVVQECLKSRKVEDLWSQFQQFRLITNMKAVQDETYQAFSDWLLRIGNGVEPHDDQDQISLPQQICIKSLEDLMNSIYPQAESADAHLLLDPNTMSERCCLTPKNEFSHHINELILQRLPTARQQYLSIDRVETDDPEEAAAYPMEFLNAQTPGGMPLHSLQLKVGATIILLRNINPAKGLCNGTRLIVRDLKRHVITAEIITTQNKGQYVMLPRITLTSQDSSLPISIARKQFPVRLAYCLTINKAQGQSLKHVGIYLPDPVFSHGQLYVAMSRGKSFSGLKVFTPSNNKTTNIVYKEVL
eukprot:gene2293-biopygen2036